MFTKIPHQIYYIVELIVLLIGFYVVYLLSYDHFIQRNVLAAVLLIYAFFGIFHHKVHHTLKGKIVLEYLLVSVLVFVLYLLLNIGRL